jgi:hypothetical protein
MREVKRIYDKLKLAVYLTLNQASTTGLLRILRFLEGAFLTLY